MECWAVTPHREVLVLDFHRPPQTLALADRLLHAWMSVDDSTWTQESEATYVTYRRWPVDLPDGRAGYMYSVHPPTRTDVLLLAARLAEFAPRGPEQAIALAAETAATATAAPAKQGQREAADDQVPVPRWLEVRVPDDAPAGAPELRAPSETAASAQELRDAS